MLYRYVRWGRGTTPRRFVRPYFPGFRRFRHFRRFGNDRGRGVNYFVNLQQSPDGATLK